MVVNYGSVDYFGFAFVGSFVGLGFWLPFSFGFWVNCLLVFVASWFLFVFICFLLGLFLLFLIRVGYVSSGICLSGIGLFAVLILLDRGCLGGF